MLPASSGQNGTASFTVQIPSSASAGASIPHSITVTVTSVNGIGLLKPLTTTVNLMSGTAGCTALSGGGLSCVVSVTAPKGNDAFSLATFDGLNGTGNTLATQRANAVVNANATTKCTPKSTMSTATGARS